MVKDDVLRKFALSKGRFSTFDLVISVVMMFSGAEILFSMHPIHRYGFSSVAFFSSISLSLILFGFLFSSKIVQMKVITMGDIIQDVWGVKAKLIYGVMAVSNSIIIVALQLSVLGKVFELLCPLSPYFNKILIALIVVWYSSYGGISSVVKTHKTLFFILLISLPILLFFGLSYIGGWGEFIKYITTNHVTYVSDKISWSSFFSFCFVCSLGVLLSPTLIQNSLMARNPLQSVKSSFFSGLLIFFLVTSIGVISFIYYIFVVVISPGISLIEIFGMLPLFLRIFMILTLLSMVLSTVDGALNCGAVHFINDVIGPFNQNNIQTLKMIKIALFFLGIISIFISIRTENIFKNLTYCHMVWISIMVPSLMGIILNKIISKAEFYTCILVGGSILLGWVFFKGETLNFGKGSLFAFAVNFLIYVSFYFRRNFYKFRILMNKLF